MAWNGVSIQDLLSAAGYIDSGENIGNQVDSRGWEQLQQWQRVIEEADRYNISPEDALDFIKSLGKSMARMRKEHA